MKEQELDLCVILKGHEGETFYSPIFGNIKLQSIHEAVYFITDSGIIISFVKDGKYIPGYKNAECLIFPSKNKQNWNKWNKEHNPKIPKTWEEISEVGSNIDFDDYSLECYNLRDGSYNGHYDTSKGKESIEKVALAILKIYQLIEKGYGGNITKDEWKDATNWKYTIICESNDKLYVECAIDRRPIAFHTEEQAKEFMSYPENIQLVKDFFMM